MPASSTTGSGPACASRPSTGCGPTWPPTPPWPRKTTGRPGRLVQQRLAHWGQDPDLAAVRDDKALAALPEKERQAWRKLWADVAALRKKVEGKKEGQ